MTQEKNKQSVFFVITILTSLVVGVISGGMAGVLSNQYAQDYFSGRVADISSKSQILKVQEDSATVDVVEKVAPSVVSIMITKELQNYNYGGIYMFPFGGIALPDEGGIQEIGGGTGFIIAEDGYILTNNHVVSDPNASYTVITNDGTKYEAKIAGTDPNNDIAVIKIDSTNLPVVDIGDSDELQLGQTVIAIGNVFSEFPNTVTRGIISGINRNVTAGDSQGFVETIQGAIQTDAAINPGNSGGPLLNLSGEVIGINTAVSQQGQLVGFAIPINIAKKAVNDVREYGKIFRPFLGIRYIDINNSVAKANNLSEDYGILIVRGSNPEELAVLPGSPADKAGLKENDIILEVNGEKITGKQSLSSLLSKNKPGDEITLTIKRKGDSQNVKVTLGEAPTN